MKPQNHKVIIQGNVRVLTVLFFFFSPMVFSQTEDFCATPVRIDPDPVGVYSKSTDPSYLATFSPKTFNIFYWRINKNDGSYTQSGTPLTPQKVLVNVELLNDAYADLNICFNLIGMDTINSTAHHTGSGLGSINAYAEADNYKYKKQNAFNIYVPHRLAQGSGAARYNRAYLAINDASLTNAVITHEVGHSFNLIHTFGGDPRRPDSVDCERVTRYPDDIEYNAHEAGDEVTDTGAVPNFFREQHVYFAYALEEADIGYDWYDAWQIAFLENGFINMWDAADIEQALITYGFTQAEINHLKFNPAENNAYSDIPNCSYAPDSRLPANSFFKDCGGTPYQVLEADCRNIMAYFDSVLPMLFSDGQAIRVHEAIEEDQYGEFDPRISLTEIDLYIQDTETDMGQEPNVHTTIFWNSEDIWVRNQNDGTVVQEHQNPVYDPNQPYNYVYVRVRNNACNASYGNEQLKLYWAKANTALDWPDYWDDYTIIDSNGQEVLMGDELGRL